MSRVVNRIFDITVQDALPGIEFKIPGKRKWNKAKRVIELTQHDHIEPKGRKTLFILENCQQMTLLNTSVITIIE